jgi:hypothetical protein
MADTAWVVWGTSGEYSDRSTWIVASFDVVSTGLVASEHVPEDMRALASDVGCPR